MEHMIGKVYSVACTVSLTRDSFTTTTEFQPFPEVHQKLRQGSLCTWQKTKFYMATKNLIKSRSCFEFFTQTANT